MGLASAAELPLTLRIGNATVSFVAYLRQFVWPAGLACFYPHPGDSLPAWKVAGASAVLLAITSAVILRWEKRRYLMVGWFWYTGMLVPVIGVAQVGGQSMADRYTYLPEIGLCAAIVWAAASVADARPSMRPMFSIAAGIVLGACAVAMWIQVGYWRNSETLWKRTIACTTPSFVPHYRLAIALAKQERFDEAIAEFEAALQFLPDAEAENNLGSAAVSERTMGRSDRTLPDGDRILARVRRSAQQLGHRPCPDGAPRRSDRLLSPCRATPARLGTFPWMPRYGTPTAGD